MTDWAKWAKDAITHAAEFPGQYTYGELVDIITTLRDTNQLLKDHPPR